MTDAMLVAALSTHERPDDALVRAVAEPQAVADVILEVLEEAAAGTPLSEAKEDLLFWGLHVLAAAREKRAFGPLMRLLRRPDDEVDLLLGDAVTATLPRLIVGTFDDDAAALLDAIADREIDGYTRGSLLRAVAFLTWDGRIGLADTVRLIERIDDERLAGPEDDLWNGWEDVITLLGLRPLAPRVEAAFKDGRISPEMDDIKDFYRRLGAAERDPQDKERFEAAHVGYLDDILRVLSLFKSEGRQNYVATDDSELPVLHDPFEDGAMTNPFRHVGRNDPCPCGSGKKFKKCCLNA